MLFETKQRPNFTPTAVEWDTTALQALTPVLHPNIATFRKSILSYIVQTTDHAEFPVMNPRTSCAGEGMHNEQHTGSCKAKVKTNYKDML